MANTTAVDPSITMRELLETFPGAQRALFRRYHIGGCSSCGFQPAETLAQVCARNGGLPVDEVIEHIRTSHEEDLRTQIEPRDLAGLLENHADVRVLDIRTREEHEAARIEGSHLFTQDFMREILMHWPKDGLVVIYDHEGRRSPDAAAYFAGQGFQKVKSLRGGVDAWSREVDASVPRYQLA